MNENYIKKLIKLVEESEIESLEVSSWGRKIRITQKLNASANGQAAVQTVVQPMAVAPTAPVAVPAASAPTAEAVPVENDKLIPVVSPMVGTFYTAPSPDADPYVSLNQKVTNGQVVCIVEAMKLMNEIEAEASGRIVKILVENAQPVEYGQTMFLIDPEG